MTSRSRTLPDAGPRTDQSFRGGFAPSLAFGLVALMIAVPACSHSERLTDRVARQSTERIGDRVMDVVGCAMDDGACIEAQAASGQMGVPAGAGAGSAGNSNANGQEIGRPGEGVWANYDFIPGERILFAEDLTADRVGDFPRRFEFVRGNMEIVEWEGRRFLRSTGYSRFRVRLPEALPERFTIEFDLNKGYWNYDETAVLTEPWDGNMNNHEGTYFELGAIARGGNAGIRGRGAPEAVIESRRLDEEIVPVRIMVDGSHVKMFLGERRIANVPNAVIRRSDTMEFRFRGDDRDDGASYIANLRIAAGGRDLYRTLADEGRWVTRGIYFDTGSDRIRPESTGTLDEIGRTLRDHPGLRLRVEGHTDSVGSADMNQTLSERRAAAVVAHLTRSHGIDAGRLEAAGIGQTQPVDSNDTPEGRQNNRRVELVRIDG